MNENHFTFLFCAFALITRMPRLVERWKAPVLRGRGWFFSVEVPSDFLAGPGLRILRGYRARLFLPWAIEVPIFIGLLLTGRSRYLVALVAAVTLLTRLNYYAARARAEKRAKQFELAAAATPVSSISVSLQPRTLRVYTTPWLEAAIILSTAAPLAWLSYRFVSTHDWQLVRKPLAQILYYTYVQAGMLLLKCGLVRARYVAPTVNTDQHLAWRESLRRFSAIMCDYLRLFLAVASCVVAILSAVSVNSESKQTASILLAFGMGGILSCLEWRRRLQYLQVARHTKPAKLFTTRDVAAPIHLICFQPSLPVLLLAGPNGYAVNLASAAAKITGLYCAGYGLLWVGMKRLGA